MNRLQFINMAAVASLSVACGTSGGKSDAGSVDTSCGVDCAAQARLGLLPDTCFEYSQGSMKVPFPALGVRVMPVSELEGGLKVIELAYLESGQTKMTDALSLKDGELRLVRRTYQPGQSVTFRDSANALVGVKWMGAQSSAGENHVTTSTAHVVGGPGGTKQESSSYTSAIVAAETLDLTTPAGTFDAGLALVLSETNNRAADSLRVWVPDVGFIRFSTSFDVTGASSKGYRLQTVRSLKSVDGGTPSACSLGDL